MSWKLHPSNTPARAARTKQYNSAEYRRARQTAKRHVETGRARCWRCGHPIDPRKPWHLGHPIDPRKPWHLGHDDSNRSIIRGPEHPSCNLRAASRKANQASKQHARQRRNWTL